MGTSVRSHLVAVTATIVVTGAVAVTPVQRLPAIEMPPTAMVTLAGFVSPLSEVFGTLSLASTYLFSPANPTSADAWPSAQFGSYWGDPPVAYPVLPEILSEAALGGYSAVGLIPQIVNDGLPALRQLAINASDYLDTAVNAVATAGIAISQGVWNLPSAVITATQEALGGDVAGALATLRAAIRGPITTAGTALLAAGTYVLTGVTTRAAAVLAGLTSERAYGLAVGGVPLLIRTVVEIATTTVADLAALNIEGAWNTAVAGLLGPSGLQGMGLNITIGAGVQTGPIASGSPTQEELSANYIPGTRTAVQTNVKIVASGLAVPNPAPPVAPPVAAPSAARSASAVSEQPSKHRVSRTTARTPHTYPSDYHRATPRSNPRRGADRSLN